MSNLRHRDEILSVIANRNEGDIDKNEQSMKRLYPQDYAQIHKDCYPDLRRTDYYIEYEIRQYTSIEEIRDVFRKSPSKLSLNELFILANNPEECECEGIEVFRTAANLYPNSELANLNAASAAMSEEGWQEADYYLQRAGVTPKSQYLRGVLKVIMGDIDEGKVLLHSVEEQMPEAKDALQQLDQ